MIMNKICTQKIVRDILIEESQSYKQMNMVLLHLYSL